MNIPAGISTLNRDQNFSTTGKESFDVLIIGGGITGAGIALDAASRNLKVLLVEKQDFAAGTSSRSTKLIHGGLRYLKNLEFGLVRTVARERKILQNLAPHLVTPEPMLLPVLKNTSYNFWATALGLTLYEFLGTVSGPERHKMLGRKKTLNQEPLLNPEGLLGSGLFTEYRTDDARLTIEVLKTAQIYSATCLNYVAFSEFIYSENKKITGAIITDMLTGKNSPVKAKCIINAAGPGVLNLWQWINRSKNPSFIIPKASISWFLTTGYRFGNPFTSTFPAAGCCLLFRVRKLLIWAPPIPPIPKTLKIR